MVNGDAHESGPASRPLRRAARTARAVARLVELEQAQRAAAGSREPALWRRGFVSSRRALYPGIEDRRVRYLSDLDVEEKLRRVNTATGRTLLEDKLVFAEALAARGLADRAPEVYGTVLRGTFRPRAGGALERLHEQERVVLKPVRGRGGRGVRLVRPQELGQGAARGLGEDVLVQEVVAPDPAWSAINPASLNTVRVMALRPVGAPPVLAAAVHRFGTAASGAVDNLTSGGVACRVDLASGVLGPAVGMPSAGRRVEHDAHPDTGVVLRGRVVPGWAAVRDLVHELMAAFPEVDHAGWDVCVSTTGPLVVEGNGGTPNLNLVQMHGSFLDDPRVRGFYAAHGLRPA
ncbi:sugar-transfer associated ATP-grasp domain-containing protein [Pseudokineococcus basanitobsidens]|uniref:Sugar-transfer associated ATP-grasp domain-containing protein n=1 Tax=Pseudokineococcus basanitobsidens TaxID=1926649 RepID=A0ABU8RJS9_9ACTN